MDYKQIDTIYNKIENSNYMNLSTSNEYINEYSKKLKQIKNEGLTAYTYFHDLTGNGFQGSGKECPSNYLTNINSITKYDKNKEFFSEFNCNEFWNISTENYGEYIYKNKQEININHYSGKEEKNPPLLNYLEFSLEEIIERYSDLKINNSEIYYEIINQFKALENFRKNNITNEQISKMIEYNDKLNQINDDIINIMKQNIKLSKDIIDFYKNIFKGYSNNYNYSSFLDCSFIKIDINFLFSEIENSFIFNINKCFKNHLLVNIINYISAVILVLYYSLISYEIPPNTKKTKSMIKSKTNINDNNISEHKKKIDYLMNGSAAFAHGNIEGNVTIIKGRSTINNNNLNSKYNIMFFGKDKDLVNVGDLMSLNKDVGSKTEIFNKMATKEQRGSNFTNNIEEKNEVDNSKVGIIDRVNNDGNRILSKFKNNNNK